jgi:hypothetical protein
MGREDQHGFAHGLLQTRRWHADLVVPLALDRLDKDVHAGPSCIDTWKCIPEPA